MFKFDNLKNKLFLYCRKKNIEKVIIYIAPVIGAFKFFYFARLSTLDDIGRLSLYISFYGFLSIAISENVFTSEAVKITSDCKNRKIIINSLLNKSFSYINRLLILTIPTTCILWIFNSKVYFLDIRTIFIFLIYLGFKLFQDMNKILSISIKSTKALIYKDAIPAVFDVALFLYLCFIKKLEANIILFLTTTIITYSIIYSPLIYSYLKYNFNKFLKRENFTFSEKVHNYKKKKT